MGAIITNVSNLRRYREGVTSIEYALLASVITIAMYPWLYIIGAEIDTPFLQVYEALARIYPY